MIRNNDENACLGLQCNSIIKQPLVCKRILIFENRRLRQDNDFQSRILEPVAADRLQVG